MSSLPFKVDGIEQAIIEEIYTPKPKLFNFFAKIDMGEPQYSSITSLVSTLEHISRNKGRPMPAGLMKLASQVEPRLYHRLLAFMSMIDKYGYDLVMTESAIPRDWVIVRKQAFEMRGIHHERCMNSKYYDMKINQKKMIIEYSPKTQSVPDAKENPQSVADTVASLNDTDLLDEIRFKLGGDLSAKPYANMPIMDVDVCLMAVNHAWPISLIKRDGSDEIRFDDQTVTSLIRLEKIVMPRETRTYITDIDDILADSHAKGYYERMTNE